MKAPKLILRLIAISIFALYAGSVFGWDTRWKFKLESASNHYRSGTTAMEMQKKFDYNSMNTFKGTTDSSNGYTVMRNLNGGAMRGYIHQDGSGLLRDDKGNFHSVNTRW
jgi:hypothetical protein